MDVLIDRMRREAERAQSNRGKTKNGLVTSYDPNSYAIKAFIPVDGYETGWMPLGSPMIGNGWGVFLAPSPNDQVVIEFQEDSHEVPIATLRLYDNKNRPLAAPSGEMWFVHLSGSYIKLTNDGKISFNAATEIDAGNLGSALHTLVTDAFMSLFNNHTHSNGNNGANTGAPLTQMSAAHFTSVLKAN